MTELERDSCFREIAQGTESIKRIFERRHPQEDEEVETPHFPTIKKARRVFSTSNVPIVERHTTLVKTIKGMLMFCTSSTLWFIQGVFK